ncbi:hypothetical protein F4779DRAFT_565061 [Xylariaceae sp. FL0662B]|nr:hypothetical protein F4779DRAFT_565061 [Xylariaceae sp. FL0662B]
MATSTSGTVSSQVNSMNGQPPAPTITLPPQTTPYTVPSNPELCRMSVYCKYMSHAYFAPRGHPLSGEICQAVHGRTADNGEITGVQYIESCYPDGYFTVFNDLFGEIRQATSEPYEGASSTLAYPGTVCISDWTTACVTTVTHEDSLYTQAWCCPQGRPDGPWQCTDRQGDRDPGFLGRHCISRMTESTPIWISWDPPATFGNMDYYTWTVTVNSVPAEYAASVYHSVFPLQYTANASTPASGNNSTAATGGSQPVAGSDLSRGAVAGIAVGVILFVLGILVASFFFYRKRKKAATGEPEQPPETEQATEIYRGKPELEGTLVAQAREVIPKAELDAGDSERQRPTSELPAEGSQQGTISPLGSLSPNPTVSDGIYPSPESRHRSVFEMPG